MAQSENPPGVSEPSGTSDEDNNRDLGGHDDATIKDAESSGKRSYECVYCKRGFTNAQALGGHMNIHRKDRANQSLPSSSSSSRQIPVTISPSLISPWSHSIPDAPATSVSHSIGSFPRVLDKIGTYRPGSETLWSELSHSSAASPGLLLPTDYLGSYLQVATSSTSSRMSGDQEEALGSNLSLQVGSSDQKENAEEKVDQRKEEEIDLELRLGRDP